MAAPKLVLSPRRALHTVLWSGLATTIVSVALGYAISVWTGWLYAAVALAMVSPTVGIWYLAMDHVLLRPNRLFLRQFAKFEADVQRLVEQGMAAAKTGDAARARMVRARLVAVIVNFRDAMPANAPIKDRVEALIDRAWPDTDDVPPADPDEIFLQLDAFDVQASAVAEAAVDRVKDAIVRLIEAKTRQAHALRDYRLSVQGGFDDPDKAAAVRVTTAELAQRVHDVQFAAITSADEVKESEPRLAAMLADLCVALSKMVPEQE